MIKLLSELERLQMIQTRDSFSTLPNVLSETEDDILHWMAAFSEELTASLVTEKAKNTNHFNDNDVYYNIPAALSVLNVPKGYDFKPIVNMFEQAGFRPFPVRSEYNLNNRGEMGEFIIRSVLTLYDDAAENPELSRTENGLIARDFRAYEHLPTSIIKAGDKKTPFDRLQKTMARPNKFRS